MTGLSECSHSIISNLYRFQRLKHGEVELIATCMRIAVEKTPYAVNHPVERRISYLQELGARSRGAGSRRECKRASERQPRRESARIALTRQRFDSVPNECAFPGGAATRTSMPGRRRRHPNWNRWMQHARPTRAGTASRMRPVSLHDLATGGWLGIERLGRQATEE
jgi:hypothetical protein